MHNIDSAGRVPLRLLARLNLFGLDFLDLIILAALADERPLLLIGPHGTAKSELLNRLAGTLGLEHRHYNASLISFDDILGYPLPDTASGTVKYLRTPGDLWDAECVFLDEISRCRPETQNKLFSVIHEKRVQGLALPNLRYRWGAMNPPLTDDTDPGDAYEGSLPLDPALADRFAWVVELPALIDLAPEDRIALISRGGTQAGSPPDLGSLVGQTRQQIAGLSGDDLAWITRYVDGLVPPLAEARLAISGRRAVMLAGGIASLHAASLVLGQNLKLEDCGLAAVRTGLPQRAQGRVIEASKLTAIHRAAVRLAGEPASAPMRRIRALRDPARRVAEGLRLYGHGVDKTELSTLVSDAFAGLTVPRRYLFARHVLPIAAARDCLNAPALELLAEPIARVATVCGQKQHAISISRADTPHWNALSKRLARLRRGSADEVELGNIFLTLALVEKERFDPDVLTSLDGRWQTVFRKSVSKRKAV